MSALINCEIYGTSDKSFHAFLSSGCQIASRRFLDVIFRISGPGCQMGLRMILESDFMNVEVLAINWLSACSFHFMDSQECSGCASSKTGKTRKTCIFLRFSSIFMVSLLK